MLLREIIPPLAQSDETYWQKFFERYPSKFDTELSYQFLSDLLAYIRTQKDLDPREGRLTRRQRYDLHAAEAKAKHKLSTMAWASAGMGLVDIWRVHAFHFKAKTHQREQYVKQTEDPQGKLVITADFAENLTLPLGPVPFRAMATWVTLQLCPPRPVSLFAKCSIVAVSL